MRPVVIFAYNRPHYLQKMLESVKDQIGDRDVFVFVDGPRSHSDVIPIKNSINLVKMYIPKAIINAATSNLGVAFNQKRGRDFAFQRYDSVIFLEDDVILNDYYIEMLEDFMDQVPEKTSMVSCFGESHRHPEIFSYMSHLGKHDDIAETHEINYNKICQMEHVWAYGMFRKPYEDALDIMKEYYRMLPSEYRARPHQKIYDYFRDMGVNTENIVSSQDSCMSASFVLKGYTSLSTFSAHFQYIGEWGEHSRPDIFRRDWGTQVIYNKRITDFCLEQDHIDNVSKYLQDRFLV